jgi:hypothetical protein
MLHLRTFLIILVLANIIFGQITQRNFLAGKLTIDFVKTNLIKQNEWLPYPKTPAEWKSRLPENILNSIVKKGETTAKKEIPNVSATLLLEYVRNGNRSNYEKESFARRKNLMDLVLAETIEDKGRFTDQIANYVWIICEETYWGVPAHLSVQKAGSGLPDETDHTVDLFTAETAAALALTDYFVGEKLDKVSPLLRKRIYLETDQKLFEPLKDQKRYSWLNPTRQVNNWNPWIISNAMAAVLLLEKDETKRAENLYQYLKYLDIYLNGLGEEGGCDEGPSYWFAAGASVFDALEILNSATNGKINIYREPLIGKMASYVYKMHIADDYFVNFADADPSFAADGFLLYRYGKALNDQTLMQFGSYFVNRGKGAKPLEFIGENLNENGFFKPRHLNNLLTLTEISKVSPNYEPVPDAWFGDIQVLTARSKNGLFLAAHAGNNGESHNHNDVGDFIVYYKNEPIIIDAGRGNYTAKTFSSKRYELWFTQSQFHNLPIINGFGQKDGKAFAGEEVKSSITQEADSLSMDIAKAYPKEAGVTKWNRVVTLNRNTDAVTITDDYLLEKQPSSLQQIFMTVGEVDVSEKGKIKLLTPAKKMVILNYDAKQWTVSLEKPSVEGPEYSSFATKWNGKFITRIVLTANNFQIRDKFNYSVTMTN